MDRRQVLLGLATTLGSTLILPLARVLAADADPVALTGGEDIFSDAQRADIGALCEVIIPTTDTPGAIEAGVPGFIEFMLAEWHSPEEKAAFLKALGELTTYSQKTHGTPFSTLSVDAQNGTVAAMEAGTATGMTDGGKMLFEHAKQMTLAGYYTSETGMTVERHYLPVPGSYDGAYPYEKVGTLFTS